VGICSSSSTIQLSRFNVHFNCRQTLLTCCCKICLFFFEIYSTFLVFHSPLTRTPFQQCLRFLSWNPFFRLTYQYLFVFVVVLISAVVFVETISFALTFYRIDLVDDGAVYQLNLVSRTVYDYLFFFVASLTFLVSIIRLGTSVVVEVTFCSTTAKSQKPKAVHHHHRHHRNCVLMFLSSMNK
jgi:hypothetical protein